MRVDVLIVGSGHAGAQCAIALRQLGYKGSVAMVGEEPELPYERPSLSKDYLVGSSNVDGLALRPAAFWAEMHVELMRGRKIVAVDAAGHLAYTDTGETFAPEE